MICESATRRLFGEFWFGGDAASSESCARFRGFAGGDVDSKQAPADAATSCCQADMTAGRILIMRLYQWAE
jgi:hypothetical protein